MAEVGLAYSGMFSGWGIGDDYVNNAMNSLGMDVSQLLQLFIFIVGMAAIYKLTLEPSDGNLPLAEAKSYALNMSVFIYGITAIMLCWIGLLSMGDSSAFQYFQF